MELNGHDSIAEAAANIVSDFLRQAIKEIDHSFGEGFAKKTPTLVASYMQAAAIKNHGDAVANELENIAHAIGDLASSVGYVGEQLAHLRSISEHFANLVDVVDAAIGKPARPSYSAQVKGLDAEHIYDAVKCAWMKLNPNASTDEHAAAMKQIVVLAGV